MCDSKTQITSLSYCRYQTTSNDSSSWKKKPKHKLNKGNDGCNMSEGYQLCYFAHKLSQDNHKKCGPISVL